MTAEIRYRPYLFILFFILILALLSYQSTWWNTIGQALVTGMLFHRVGTFHFFRLSNRQFGIATEERRKADSPEQFIEKYDEWENYFNFKRRKAIIGIILSIIIISMAINAVTLAVEDAVFKAIFFTGLIAGFQRYDKRAQKEVWLNGRIKDMIEEKNARLSDE